MASFGQILGGLGDAISVGAGGEANYQNRENNRKFADAINTFNTDPVSGLQKLMQIDRKVGTEWYDNYLQNRVRQQNADTASKKAEVEITKDQDAIDQVTLDRLAGMARVAREESWTPMRQQMMDYLKTRNYKSPIDLPEAYDAALANRLETLGLTSKDYVDNARQQQQVDETGRHNRATEIDRDDDRLVRAQQSNAQIQATLAGQATSRANAAGTQATQARAEAGRAQRAQQAEAGRNARAQARGKAPSNMPPRRVNDTLKDRSGNVLWVSKDGKTWTKP